MGLFSRKISEEQLKTVKGLLQQAQDEANAANKSVHPAKFFKHYDSFKDKLRELKNYEKYPIFRGNTPRRDLLRAEENEQHEINAMIQRSFVAVRDNADKKETVDEKQSLFEAYFEELMSYTERMDRFNKKVVRDLRAIVERQLEGLEEGASTDGPS